MPQSHERMRLSWDLVMMSTMIAAKTRYFDSPISLLVRPVLACSSEFPVIRSSADV